MTIYFNYKKNKYLNIYSIGNMNLYQKHMKIKVKFDAPIQIDIDQLLIISHSC